jgi:hypothetical protein
MAFERAVRQPARWATGVLAIVLCAAGLAGCGGNRNAGPKVFMSQEADEGGFRLFRRAPGTTNTPNAGGIGVNAYLWRASLDTLSFMPLASADPYGGIIMTDWYSNPEKPDERFKATVYILDTRLRADGVNVALHKQTRETGEWRDAVAGGDTEEALENAILTRARQLRNSGR